MSFYHAVIKVKICGIRREEDALYASECGADALGFIFYDKSPRYLSKEKAKDIIKKLPPFITTVAVFVNESVETMNEVVDYCNINIIQLHGKETPDVCGRLKRPIIKAFSIRSKEDLRRCYAYSEASAWLLDSSSYNGEYGGTGRQFEWSLISSLAREKKIILAGGLNSSNVREAIAMVNPYAVDVSSGVESCSCYGVKDKEKLREFIKIVKVRGC